jgi:hypothetical protein
MSNIKKANNWKCPLFGKYVLRMYILVLFLLNTGLHAKSKLIEKTITGTVVDNITNQPIPGANVIVKGTQSGVVTDLDGKFTIVAPVDATKLVVSYMGYKTKEVAIGGGVI